MNTQKCVLVKERVHVLFKAHTRGIRLNLSTFQLRINLVKKEQPRIIMRFGYETKKGRNIKRAVYIFKDLQICLICKK